jgi:hypothetical protein
MWCAIDRLVLLTIRISCYVIVVKFIPGYAAGLLATGSCRCHGNMSSCVVITWTPPALRRTAWRSEFQDLHCGYVDIVFQATELILRHSRGESKRQFINRCYQLKT